MGAYAGVIVISILYWMQQKNYKFAIFSSVSLLISIFVELGYRISYSTDIFAACLIAHLFHILNRNWVPQLDKYVNSKLVKYWTVNTWVAKEEAPQGGSKGSA